MELGTESVLKRYSYHYDPLNRLTEAAFSTPDTTVPFNGYYNEGIEYDLNGNIIHLSRNAPSFYSSNYEIIDNLDYNYDGNKLITVKDDSGNPSGYEGGGGYMEYDNNGNITALPDKMIDLISYNYLNLPVQIDIKDKSKKINYFYRADGTKLRKNYLATGENANMYASSTEYLDGFHYVTANGDELWGMFQAAGGSAYEMEAFEEFAQAYNYINVLKFIPTAEGFFDFENNEYIYQYKDHLGNVRVSYKKQGNELQITDSNDYYPFGMSFIRNAEEQAYFGTGSYKNYKYQGQELQETGFYSFKWRNYMPDVGRFFNVDPLTEEYPTWSPYVFSGNRVIDAREIEGLEPHVLFGTQDKAARNFGKQYNGKSILNKREYSAFIYSIDVDNKTYYAYNTPAKGNQHGIPKNKLNKYTPKGGKIVAYIHTHGNDDPEYDDENFSGEVGKQGGDIGYAEEQKLGAYLVTPGGVLEYFDVNTGEAYTLNYDMPSDPKSKNRQNTIDPEMSPLPSEGDGPRPTPKRYPNPTEPKFDNILKSIKDKKRMEIILIDQPQKYHR